MNYRGSGMCVMEMSHRSKVFQQIVDEAEADLRDLMGIPDNYKVLFIQGGATLQFAAVPWNLMKNGKAVYIDPLSDEYRSVIEARGVQLQQLQQMPAMLHAVRLDITRYELLDGALRSEGYAARQVLSLV